jgi:microcystin-dependent protein
MEGMIGDIRMFAGNFAIRGFALCTGQLLPIRQYTALFSILGANYGGDGKVTFGLPNLQGRTIVGAGSGPGLTPYDPGDDGGAETSVMTMLTMPAHTHAITGTISGTISVPVANLEANTTSPVGGAPAVPASEALIYTNTADNIMGSMTTNFTVSNVQVGNTGNSQPFTILNPILGINYLICMEGVFPVRN